MREKTRYCLLIFLGFFFFTCLGFAHKTSIPPYNPDAQGKYYFALRHFRHSEYDIALKQFYEVIRDYPDTEASAKAQYMIAETLFKLGRKEDALLAYQKILHLDITNYETWIKIGKLYEQFEKYEDSLKAYSKAIELMKYKEKIPLRICPSLKKIGDIFFNRKDYINATRFYKKIIDLDKRRAYTNYIEIEQKLASSYLHLKMYREAEHLYRDLVKNVSYKYRRYQHMLSLLETLVAQKKDEEVLNLCSRNVEDFYDWYLQNIENFYGWYFDVSLGRISGDFHVLIGKLYLKNNRLQQWQNILLKKIKEDSQNIYSCVLLAGSYAAEKDFLNAAGAYKQASEIISGKNEFKPIYLQLRRELVMSYSDGKEYLKAAEAYTHLVAGGIMNEIKLSRLGRYYLDAKEYEKAQKLFDELFKKYPDKYHNKYPIGEYRSDDFFKIYSGLGKDEEAIDLALEAIKGSVVGSDRDFIVWDLIRAYETNDRLEQLPVLLEEKIQEKPYESELYLFLAYAYFKGKKYPLAIKYYQKAVEFFPAEIYIYKQLGWLHRYLKNYNKAIDYYKKVVELATPESFTYYEILADVYCRIGKKQDALKVLEELIEKNRDLNKSKAFEIAGNIYKKCEMYNEAIPFYEKAITIDEDYHPQLLLFLTECYYQAGNFIRAEELCRETITECGTNRQYTKMEAESLLLKLYDTPKKLDKLIKKYEAVLKRYRKLNKIAKRQEKEKTISTGLFLSKVYLENNMPEKVVKILRTLLEIAPEQTDIYNQIADIYFYQVSGGTTKAIKWYEEAIQKNPQDNRALLLLGYAYERKGMYDDASEIYAALMKKSQDEGFWTQCPEARLESLKLIREKQLIKDWLVIGPFDNTKGKGFDTIYPPEIKINLEQVYEGKENREIKWFRPFEGKFGYVDFDEILSPNEDTVAYALLYIESPTEKEVQFKVGSDDTITIWLNDKKVLSKKVYRWVIIDQDTVNVKLCQGNNKVLVKVCEGNIDWGFYFRITDMYGAPVDDLRYSTR